MKWVGLAASGFSAGTHPAHAATVPPDQRLQWPRFLLLLCAVVLVRSAWTFPVVDGDALTKYFVSAEIYRTGDWSLLLHNHHTMRWVEMLPQVGLTYLVGVRFELFYVLPLLTWSLGFLAILMAVRRHLGPGALLLLAALLFCDPLGFRTSSQLLNPPFGILFVALGGWLLVTARERGNAALMGSASLFFLAYGAHVTYLGFVAGPLAWLVFREKQPRKAAVFIATLAVLLAVETLAFNALSGWDYTLGRLEGLVSTPHMQRAAGQIGATSVPGLLTRWILMPPFNLLLSLAFFSAVGGWFFNRHSCEVPRIMMVFGAAALGFAALLTVAVSDLDPVRPIVILRPRYLTPFFPFAAVVVVYALSRLADRWRPTGQRGLALAALALCSVLVVAPHWYNRPPDSLVLIRPLAFAWRAHDEYTRFTDRFMQGDLILDTRPHAYKMIPLFRHPAPLRKLDRGVASANLGEDALCVGRLDQAPLERNYVTCAAVRK